MATTLPAVLTAVVITASLVAVLGGIVGFYSNLLYEPPVLPPYGTVYVHEVDKSANRIVIDNSFGHPVEAYFYVKLKNPPANVRPFVTFYLTIAPGRNVINLLSYVAQEVSYSGMQIDYENSWFAIGGVKYSLVEGAGVAKPPQFRTAEQETFVKRGFGWSFFFGRYDSGASIIPSSTKAYYKETADIRIGYYRSVSNIYKVSRISINRAGSCCGYSYGRAACYDYEDIDDDGEPEACRFSHWEYYSRDYIRSCSDSYVSFTCGKRIPTLYDASFQTKLEYDFETVSFKTAYYYEKSYVKDPLEPKTTFGGTKTPLFPYEKPDGCSYTYRYYSCSAHIRYSTDSCGTGPCRRYITERDCYGSCRFVYSHKVPNGCAPDMCIKYGYFYTASIPKIWNEHVIDLTKKEVYMNLKFNYKIQYEINNDPNLADSVIRIFYDHKVEITLPPLEVYFSVPYTNFPEKATLTITPKIISQKVTLKSKSFTRTFPLNYVADGCSVSLKFTPEGYLAIYESNVESAKTFKATASGCKIILYNTNDFITNPLRSSDELLLTIELTVVLNPELEVVA